ncbi:MAG: cytidine deaminase [Bacteroidota bacterium]
MDQKTFTVSYQKFNSISELGQEDQLLCMKAEEALASSYSPYSKFSVGTAIKLIDGSVVLGSNQENVAYPSGLCAERVGLFAVGALYPKGVVEKMVITARSAVFQIDRPVTSCGACLQVMAEFEQKQHQEIEVLFYCIGGDIIKTKGIKNLLPFAFVEERLGN